MKQMIFPIIMLLFTVNTHAQSLEERVDTIEMNQLLNTIRLNGGLWNEYGNIKREEGSTESTVDIFRMKFNLDMAAELSKKFSFYGRYTVTKLLNEGYSFSNDLSDDEDNNDASFSETGLSANDLFNDTRPTLERAFVNIGLTDNLIMSVGRLPTVDGPPEHFRDDSPRSGTYPKMGYSAALDGIAFTYNKKLGQAKNLATRFLYTPMVNTLRSSGFMQPVNDLTGTNLKEISDVYTFMLDYTDTNVSWADSYTAILQYVSVPGLEVANAQVDSDSDGTADLTAGTHITGDLSIDYTYINLHFEATNVAHTSLDFAVSVLLTELANDGSLALPAGSPFFGTTFGLAEDADKTANGMGYILALKYKLPVWNKPSIGLEYLVSDKGYFYVDYSNEDLLNFYGTLGNAMHLYYSQAIGDYSRVRIGYMSSETEYGNPTLSGSTVLGKRSDLTTKPKNTVMYVRLRSEF